MWWPARGTPRRRRSSDLPTTTWQPASLSRETRRSSPAVTSVTTPSLTRLTRVTRTLNRARTIIQRGIVGHGTGVASVMAGKSGGLSTSGPLDTSCDGPCDPFAYELNAFGETPERSLWRLANSASQKPLTDWWYDCRYRTSEENTSEFQSLR